jgi:hypothetical protein
MRWCPTPAGDGLASSALGASVCLRSLTSDRQSSAMALAAIALNVDQSADIHLIFTAKVSFDRDARAVNAGPDTGQRFFAQITHSSAGFDAESCSYIRCALSADPVNGREADHDSKIVRYVYTCDDCHCTAPQV